jgi:hydroxylaminobenzene mutase
MNTWTAPTVTAREGHRLLQIGIALLLFTSIEGFAVPSLRAPHLGLSAHTLSALQAVLSCSRSGSCGRGSC